MNSFYHIKDCRTVTVMHMKDFCELLIKKKKRKKNGLTVVPYKLKTPCSTLLNKYMNT